MLAFGKMRELLGDDERASNLFDGGSAGPLARLVLEGPSRPPLVLDFLQTRRRSVELPGQLNIAFDCVTAR